MEIKELKEDLNLRKNIKMLKKNIKEYLELFLEITQLEKLDFYKYNFEYDEYTLDFSLSNNKDVEILIQEKKYSIVLKLKNIILGKIVFSRRFKPNKAINKLINFLQNKLLEIHNLSKSFKGDESSLNIFIVSNSESKIFAKKLQNDVSALFNANVTFSGSLKKITYDIESKSSKNIILYTVSDYETIKKN